MTMGMIPAADMQRQAANAIAAINGSEPLAAIDVIIDRSQDAEPLRRQLVGRGLLPGLVNVRFRSVEDVVESLPGKGLGPTVVFEARVQSTMRRQGGVWAAVADNPGAVAAMTRAVKILRHLPSAPDTVGVQEQTRAVVGIAAQVLADISAAPVPVRAPEHIVVLAQQVPTCVERWLAGGAHVIRLSADLSEAAVPVVYSCPDPLAEADVIARLVVEALALPGARADRIAVLMGDEEGLRAGLQAALDAAGVPWFAAAQIPLATTSPARSVVALLDMIIARQEGALTRTELFAWWASAPVLVPDGGSTSRWRSFIRRENLYGDVANWVGPLGAVAEEAAAATTSQDDRSRSSAERRLANSQGLSGFLESLSVDVEKLLRAASVEAGWWSQVGGELLALWRRYHRFRAPGKTPEGRAVLRIASFLNAELPLLDGVADYDGSLPQLRQLLVEHLATTVRAGDAAVGVRLGTLQDGLASVYDTTILAGMREGCAPSLPAHDPLLPDTDRIILRTGNALSPQDLPLAMQASEDQQAAYESVLASAATVIATYSRASLRGRAKHLPSRFLPAGGVIEVASFGGPDGLAAVDMRAIEPQRPDLLERRIATHRAMDNPQPDAFFGMLATGEARVVDAATAKDSWSATAIESFLHCPYGFFVQRILGFRVDEIEDELVEMRAHDFGTLLHDSLEMFVHRERAAGTLPGPGQPWPDGAADRLRAILAAEVLEAERRGLHGRSPGWAARREELLASMDDMLVVDGRLREEYLMAPGEPEFTFGPRTTAVHIELAGGRRMGLLGAIDRLDHVPGRAMVLDYKSGSMTRMRSELSKGGKVQHLIYAYAASQLKSIPMESIVMAYLFVPNRGSPGVLKAEVDAALLTQVVTQFDTELAAGRFLPKPAGSLDYCRVCQHLGRAALRLAPAALEEA